VLLREREEETEVGGSEGKPGEIDGCFSAQAERAHMDGLS